MSGFVYMWINKLNSKKYIGSHIGSQNDGYIGSGPIFKKAIEKYGIDNFERIILEEVDDKLELRKREEYYLELFNVENDKQFYNVRNKAGGSWEYINKSPEIRQKLKELYKDRWDRIPHPKGMKDKKHSSQSKKKISESSKKSAKTRTYNKSKPVIKLDFDGNIVGEYDSITQAAKSVKGSASNIKYCIEGKFKTAYKHHWKYKDVLWTIE